MTARVIPVTSQTPTMLAWWHSIAFAGLLLCVGCTSDAVLGALGDGSGGGDDGVAIPSWVPESGYWSTVSLNTLADVNPCPDDTCSWSGPAGQAGVLDSWSGGAIASTFGVRGALLAWGGGGGSGYYGNEVYAYDLDARTWARLSEPVPDPQPTAPLGELQDGSPMVTQINGLMEFHPPTGSLAVLGGSADFTISATDTGHLFTLSEGTWRRTAALPIASHLGASAYDPARELLWAVTQGGDFFAYAPAGAPDGDARYGSVSRYGNLVSLGTYTVAAIDPRHDVFVLFDAISDRVTGIELSAPAMGQEVVVEGSQPSLAGGGFVWVGERDAFFWYSGVGDDIRTLTPPGPDDDWRTVPWAWAPVEVLGGPSPQPRRTPIFGAWRWASAISSFVICTRADQPVHAFRP